MPHTHHTHFALKHTTIVALFLGIVTVISSGGTLLNAQLLSEGGSILVQTHAGAQSLAVMPELHAAAGVQPVDPSVQARLIIGMLMILLGFLLHLLNLRRMTHWHAEPIQKLRTKHALQMKSWYLKYLDQHLGDRA